MPPVARRRAGGKTRGAHISKFAGIVCIACAVIVDMIQAFLALFGAIAGTASLTVIGTPVAMAGIALSFVGGFLLSAFSYLAFGFYFLFVARVRLLSGRHAVSRVGALFGSLVFELAPFFNGFPWLSAGVIHIVQTTWQEMKQASPRPEANRDHRPQEGKPPQGTSRAANDNAPASRPVPRAAPPAAKEIPKRRPFAA